MPARKPNFFIVGAPKCGTTSTGTGAASMTPAIRTILVEHFTPEIRILESLLDRDLRHWLAPAPSGDQ